MKKKEDSGKEKEESWKEKEERGKEKRTPGKEEGRERMCEKGRTSGGSYGVKWSKVLYPA